METFSLDICTAQLLMGLSIHVCWAKRGWVVTNISNLRAPSTSYNTHPYVKSYYFFMLTELRVYLEIKKSRLTKIKENNFY